MRLRFILVHKRLHLFFLVRKHIILSFFYVPHLAQLDRRGCTALHIKIQKKEEECPEKRVTHFGWFQTEISMQVRHYIRVEAAGNKEADHRKQEP